MRQLTYVGGTKIEWWDVPEPKLLDDRDAIVAPLAVTRCDLDLAIAGGRVRPARPVRARARDRRPRGRCRRRREEFLRPAIS